MHYLYHSIITNLTTGEMRHYFGRHNNTKRDYKGSGTMITEAKKYKGHIVIEHIILGFYPEDEIKEREKELIKLGKQQFGFQCCNIANTKEQSVPTKFAPVSVMISPPDVAAEEYKAGLLKLKQLEMEYRKKERRRNKKYKNPWSRSAIKEIADKYFSETDVKKGVKYLVEKGISAHELREQIKIHGLT